MSGHADKHKKKRTEKPETLAEMLFPHRDLVVNAELEIYRQQYEAVHGPTDITRRYTSTWPKEHQDWLIENDPKTWFDGLPPFAKAYMRGKVELATGRGRSDDLPDYLIKLYASKQMKLDCEKNQGWER